MKAFQRFSLSILVLCLGLSVTGFPKTQAPKCNPAALGGLSGADQGYRRILPPAEVIHLAADFSGNWEAFFRRETLRIGTFNVENLFTSVGSFKPNSKTGERIKVQESDIKPEWKRKLVADKLLKVGYDVVVLQEVEGTKSVQEFCAKDLRGEYVPLFIRGNDQRGIDVAVLVKKGTPLEFTYESHRDETWSHPLYPNKKKLFSRDVSALVARVPGQKKPLFVLIGGHGKSKRTDRDDDPESNIVRGAQGDRTADIVQYYRNKYEGTPVFLAEDFNDEVNTAKAYEKIRALGMKDAFDVARNGALPVGDPGRISHTYHPKGGATQKTQIDAVMVSPEGHDLVLETKVSLWEDVNGKEKPPPDTWAERNKNGSDHMPIWVDLDFQEMLKRAGIDPRTIQHP